MNDVKMDKRPYRSPLRREQAEATRQRILEAGLRLFAERGYAASSISQIALEAGVSSETIYASVGSKRGIIDALLAQVDTMRIPDKAREAAAARGGGARVAIEVLAEMAVGFWAKHHVLVGVLRNGIGDPEKWAALLTPTASAGPTRAHRRHRVGLAERIAPSRSRRPARLRYHLGADVR